MPKPRPIHRTQPLTAYFSPQVYLIATLLLALVLRLIGSTQSFWLDETAQAIISQHPFQAGHFNGDFQPPLTYYLVHAWLKVGMLLHTQAEWFLRLPNILISVATVYMLYKLIRALSNTQTGLIGALLLATAPFHIYYAHEFRMYALLTFLSVASCYALITKRWTSLALVTLLGIFTHYFMFVHIVAQGVFTLIFARENIRKFSVATFVGVAPFIFWLPTFFKQIETSRHLLQAWPGWAHVSNTGFIRFPGLVLAKFTVGMISPEPRWLYGLSVAITAVIIVWALVVFFMKIRPAHKPPHKLYLSLSMWIVPLMLAWVGGLFVSASSPWRIQFVLPGLYGTVALAYFISQTAENRIKHITTGLVMLMLAQNLLWTSQYLGNQKFHRENWRGAITYTDSLVRTNDTIVLSEFTAPWAPMQWYSHESNSYQGGSTEQKMTPQSVQSAFPVSHPQTIVLYTYLFELSDPDHLVEAELQKRGYTLTAQKDFRGVGIINTYQLQQGKD